MRPACRRLALAWLTFAFAEAADGAQELHTSRRGSPGMAATDAVDGAVAKLTTTTTSNPKRVSRGRLRSLLQLSFIAPPPGTPLIPGECLSRCLLYTLLDCRPLALSGVRAFLRWGHLARGLFPGQPWNSPPPPVPPFSPIAPPPPPFFPPPPPPPAPDNPAPPPRPPPPRPPRR
jgi:hypothetical protein